MSDVMTYFVDLIKQEMSLKKTGRKIETKSNLILYSIFIYREKEIQFEHILLRFSKWLSTKKKLIPKQIYKSRLTKSPFTLLTSMKCYYGIIKEGK